jgi:esterase/lipase superfamily enzyme
MKREYHKWYSPSLQRDMEVLVFGHGGTPVLVFPSSMGRFFEYEDRGMIEATAYQYESGALQAFCPDSVDGESWYNQAAHPADRVRRHMAYESYIMNELVPLIRRMNTAGDIITTGCSFGGFHAMNFALKQPDVFTRCVSMSAAFDMRQFLDGYYDDNCYYNNPVEYLPALGDSWYMDYYQDSNRFLMAVGEWDIRLGENQQMASIMHGKNIPHRLDVWGDPAVRDWPLWQRMAQTYFR